LTNAPEPDQTSSVQLSASSLPLTEGPVSATITVTRSGNLSAAASVNYATNDFAGNNNCNVLSGAASARCDYEATAGTLHFAAGETSKTILVPIVDDAYAEGAETFTVNLSNATGANLGAVSTVTVTVNDNETANGPNPLDQPGPFVRQQYIDFLNREPDASGLAFWTNEIASCGTDQTCIDVKRVNVSAAFFLSIEFQETGYLVERLYKTAYGNASGSSTFGTPHQLAVPIVRLSEFLPDTQQISRGVVIGQPGATQLLENNKQAFIAEFVQRARFSAVYPTSLTPTLFVDSLNGNAGNPLTAAERAQLISDLTNGLKTRAQVLRAVAENPVLSNNEKNAAFVLMQYLGYLRRNPNDTPDPDYTGYDFWLTKLNQFNGNFVNADMVKSFLVSGEYRHKLGP